MADTCSRRACGCNAACRWFISDCSCTNPLAGCALAASRDEVDWGIATATSSDLIADLAGRWVDQGVDLTCVIGPGRELLVTTLALAVPTARFCVGPSVPPVNPAPNVLYVDVRVEETAYLAGALTALVTGSSPAAHVTGKAAYQPGRQLAAFELGLVQSGGVAELTSSVTVADEDQAREAALTQFDTGVGILFGDADSLNRELLEVAVQTAADRAKATTPVPDVTVGLIAGPQVLTGDVLPDQILATVAMLPARIVTPALDVLLAGWEPGQASVGLTEGAVTFDLTASPLATPHVDEVNRLRGEIAAGDRAPRPAA